MSTKSVNVWTAGSYSSLPAVMLSVVQPVMRNVIGRIGRGQGLSESLGFGPLSVRTAMQSSMLEKLPSGVMNASAFAEMRSWQKVSDGSESHVWTAGFLSIGTRLYDAIPVKVSVAVSRDSSEGQTTTHGRVAAFATKATSTSGILIPTRGLGTLVSTFLSGQQLMALCRRSGTCITSMASRMITGLRICLRCLSRSTTQTTMLITSSASLFSKPGFASWRAPCRPNLLSGANPQENYL